LMILGIAAAFVAAVSKRSSPWMKITRRLTLTPRKTMFQVVEVINPVSRQRILSKMILGKMLHCPQSLRAVLQMSHGVTGRMLSSGSRERKTFHLHGHLLQVMVHQHLQHVGHIQAVKLILRLLKLKMMMSPGAQDGQEKLKKSLSQKRGHSPGQVRLAGHVGLGKSQVSDAVVNRGLLPMLVQML